MIRRPPRSTLLPNTTPFRSHAAEHRAGERREVPRDEHAADRADPVARHVGPPDALEVRRRERERLVGEDVDRKSTRLNSSHANISYAVFCLTKTNCSTTSSL